MIAHKSNADFLRALAREAMVRRQPREKNGRFIASSLKARLVELFIRNNPFAQINERRIGFTDRDIADRVGISRARVRQIRCAMRKKGTICAATPDFRKVDSPRPNVTGLSTNCHLPPQQGGVCS
jgi:hypothetical protein